MAQEPSRPAPVLEVRDLCAGYYSSSVLRNVSLTCSEGVSLVIGPNGAGKSTLVKSLVGLIRPVSGKVSYLGREIGTLNAREISLLGITTVPERARLFSSMTVLDNLKVGYSLLESRRKLDALGQASWQGRGKDFGGMLEFVVETFPDLSDRLKERAGKLSGGQQQMLAIARALISAPRFLIMDEPTTGLYPALVNELVTKIRTIAQGMPILLTEQNIAQTLPLASYVYLLESGRIVLQGRPEEILDNERARRAYLGDVRSQAGAAQKRG